MEVIPIYLWHFLMPNPHSFIPIRLYGLPRFRG